MAQLAQGFMESAFGSTYTHRTRLGIASAKRGGREYNRSITDLIASLAVAAGMVCQPIGTPVTRYVRGQPALTNPRKRCMRHEWENYRVNAGPHVR